MTNRSEILDVVKTRLQGIRFAHNCATDAGATVFLGEMPSLGPDDPPSVIAILIGDDQPRYQGEQILIRLPIMITALAKADLDDPWGSLEAMLADIKRVMELPDRRIGTALKSPLTRGSTRTLAREAGGTTVGVGVTYWIDYAECWGAP